MGKKPGSNTGNQGGIYQEIGPRGGEKPNFTTVPDNHVCPRRPRRGIHGSP